MTPDQEATVLEVLDGARDMTVATVRPDGFPQATTVSFVHDGLAIYFGCGTDSQKARNIAANDKVSLTVNLPYADWQEIRGVSLGGRARVVADKTEIDRVFNAMLKKFPQVKDLLETEDQAAMCMIRVDPEIISVLDYRKGFGHTEEIQV